MLLQVDETRNGEAEVFPVLHAVKMYGSVEAWLHAFITSVLDSGEMSLYIPQLHLRIKNPDTHFIMGWVEPEVGVETFTGNRTPIPQSWKP
jgi:hypothetical protein